MVHLSTQKSLALLAMIADAADSGIRREQAAATLWSRSPETQARTSLRQALSTLRAALGEGVILSHGGTLTLNRDEVFLDIDVLGRDAQDPIEDIPGFGGSFLEGVSVNEPPFEDWLSTTRAFYARSVKDRLLEVGQAALGGGDAATAVQAADRILALDAYDESGMALCLQAHAANGERSRVQLRFDEFQRVLRNDLGIDMGADLIDLKTTLLATRDAPFARPISSRVPTVTVVPFKTLSDVPEHRFFADGLAEDVIAQLSKFSTISVVSQGRTAVATAPDGAASGVVQSGSDYVLNGSVRWAGDRVRLSVELIEGQGGTVKWADRLDRRSHDVLDLQDEVSRYLVGAIPYRIEEDVAHNANRKPLKDLQAYELMILGKRLRDTISLEGNMEARALLQRSVEKDANLARAHMYLSDSYVVQHWFGHLDASGKEKALYHAQRAAALDPFDVHIQDHLGFALHVMGLWDAAEAQIRKALALAENEIESLSWCGYLLLMLGRHDEAAELIETVSARRTTLPPTFEWIMGQVLSFQGRHAEVVQTLNGASLLNSTGLAFRAGSQARLGMTDEARFTLGEFKKARVRDLQVSGLNTNAETTEAALGGFRVLWRRPQDWDHIAEGLRLAGMPD